MAFLANLLGLSSGLPTQPVSGPTQSTFSDVLGVGSDPASAFPAAPAAPMSLGDRISGMFDMTDPRKAMAWQFIANGQKAPGQMMEGVPEAVAYAQKTQAERQKQQQEAQSSNATLKWLDANDPDLAAAVRGGMPVAQAWSTALQRQKAKQDAATAETRYAGQRKFMEAYDPNLAGMIGPDFELGDALKVYQDGRKGVELPAGAQTLKWRAAEAGLVEGTPEYQQFMQTGGTKGPLVSVNTGSNSSKFAEKSDEEAAKRLGDIVSEGRAAGGMMADMQQLADLGTQIKTGLGAQALVRLGPYAQAAGINIDKLEPAQAYDAIINRLAPQMRPAGSGAASDFDARQFLNSLPTMGNTPEANEIVNQTFQAVADNKMRAAEVARQAQMGDIT